MKIALVLIGLVFVGFSGCSFYLGTVRSIDSGVSSIEEHQKKYTDLEKQYK